MAKRNQDSFPYEFPSNSISAAQVVPLSLNGSKITWLVLSTVKLSRPCFVSKVILITSTTCNSEYDAWNPFSGKYLTILSFWFLQHEAKTLNLFIGQDLD